MGASRRNRQQGAALVEFAFVLLPLLLLTFGILLYGLVFVTQQAFAFAAQRAADAIVQVDPEPFRLPNGSIQLGETDEDDDTATGYCAAGAGLAQTRVDDVLPLASLFQNAVTVRAESSGQPGCTVTVTGGGVLPDIPLLPLPDTLRGEGFVPVS